MRPAGLGTDYKPYRVSPGRLNKVWEGKVCYKIGTQVRQIKAQA